MKRIQRILDRMFNLKAELADQSGSPFYNWRQRGKFWLNLLYGRGPAAHVYRDNYTPFNRDWDKMPSGNVYKNIISRNHDAYFSFLKICSNYFDNFKEIPYTKANIVDPFWDNTTFPPIDAIVLYSLIADKKPSVYIEVGSGNSTKFVKRAIKDHGLQTKIVSVEPCPRDGQAEICDESHNVLVQTLPVEKFAALNAGDILFNDNMHRCFQNSDVTYFFTEVLPNLKSGVIYGLHDIFLPKDYPNQWSIKFYNEQYLLMAYLLGGAGGDTILFPAAYMSGRAEVREMLLGEDKKEAPWGNGIMHGGAFWMIKA